MSASKQSYSEDGFNTISTVSHLDIGQSPSVEVGTVNPMSTNKASMEMHECKATVEGQDTSARFLSIFEYAASNQLMKVAREELSILENLWITLIRPFKQVRAFGVDFIKLGRY